MSSLSPASPPPSAIPQPREKSPPASQSPPPGLSFSSISDSIPKQAIIGIAVGAVAFVVVITILCVCCGKKRNRKGYETWNENERSLPLPLPPHKEIDRPTMSWPTRLKIALGSAKGLAYLHEDCNPKIIHRDIKAANILLDYNFEAKVADFGLAKFAPDKNTHISTRVMGTFGYLAPEYASSGKLTEKSDVFSYGVMLLELITGKKPVDTAVSLDGSLVDWARPLMIRVMEDGYYGDLVDPRLGRNYSNKEMKRMIACAAACVRHSARLRPRMSLVLRALEGGVSLEDLNEGMQPGHSRMHDSYTTNTSSDCDSQRYNEAMQKFRKLALQSRVNSSSEYSGATSEYGLAPSITSSEGQSTHEMEMGRMKNIHSFNSS